MTTEPKPIPKALHTVTVLTNVAIHLFGDGYTEDAAIDMALDILGYGKAADPHELRAKALAALNKHLDAEYGRVVSLTA